MTTDKEIWIALHEGKRVTSTAWKEGEWVETTHGAVFDEKGEFQCELNKIFTIYSVDQKNWKIL